MNDESLFPKTREALRCQVCGYPWMRRQSQPLPKRCANPQCKSRKWRADGVQVLDAATTNIGSGKHGEDVPRGDNS